MESKKQLQAESTIPMRIVPQPQFEEIKTRATAFYMGKAEQNRRFLLV